jgi:hypothetical protein
MGLLALAMENERKTNWSDVRGDASILAEKRMGMVQALVILFCEVGYRKLVTCGWWESVSLSAGSTTSIQ